MLMQSGPQALLFLLNAVVGFFTFALLLRFYMQAFRVSFRNQGGAFVVQLTNWLVLPLRRIMPGVFGLDLASLLPAYLLQILLLFAVFSLRGTAELITPGELMAILLWPVLTAARTYSMFRSESTGPRATRMKMGM